LKGFAQTLERGRFDAFFMADHVAVLNMAIKALRRSATVTSFEPFTLLSALADELGRVDAISKAAETELKALKDEFRARGLSAVTGDAFMTATEQIARRLDAKAVRDYLGVAYSRFEVAVVSTVIRVKAANRVLPIAA
jgi:hypothetical protein